MRGLSFIFASWVLSHALILCLFSSSSSSFFFFILQTHTVLIQLASDPSCGTSSFQSVMSYEEPPEPSRTWALCQAPQPHNSSLWTQQQTTQTLRGTLFVGPARCPLSGSGWAGLRSDCWNGVRVKLGVKSIEVIWQMFLHCCFCDIISRRQPQISGSALSELTTHSPWWCQVWYSRSARLSFLFPNFLIKTYIIFWSY